MELHLLRFVFLSYSLSAANLYEQLAKKIWRPTFADSQSTMPTYRDEYSALPRADSEPMIEPSPAATSSFLNEVLSALYGDTTGHPENGSFSYHKAAEHYALHGGNYLMQPPSPSFASEGGGVAQKTQKAQAQPGFDRGAKALYDRKHNQRPGSVSK